LYPLNLIADVNAFLGVIYVHCVPLDVSLPADPKTSKYYQGTHGDTDYYFFETPDLPLFAPLLNDKIGVGNFNGNTFNFASGNTIKLDVLNGALSANVLNSGAASLWMAT